MTQPNPTPDPTARRNFADLLAAVTQQLPPDDPATCAQTLAGMTTPAQRAAVQPTRNPLVRTDRVLPEVLAERVAQFREDSIPPWEAAYDSATFTPHLIGYCNDEASAKAAALAWYLANCETTDTLGWEPDPQMAVREWDEWHTLIRTTDRGTVLGTDIVVRRRREGGGS